MNGVEDGDMAFPVPATGYHAMVRGMTLRDYFAASFVIGRMATEYGAQERYEKTADMAYLLADAMLERRNK